MLQVENHTPFAVQISVLPDVTGVDTVYVIVSATFAITGSSLAVADVQRPIPTSDAYRSDPARSSLEHAGAIHLLKPSTDVLLIGEAWSPGGRPSPQVDVAVSVGPVRKVVRVFGDREWKGLVDTHISEPAPFVRMPLVYERAFGGVLWVDQNSGTSMLDRRNPAGLGFAREGVHGEIGARKLPNLEDPAHLIARPSDEPLPAGFGPIAPFWEPRCSFTGTYDDVWRKTRAPYLPRDFDDRFFNTAHPDLVCKKHLQGGEPVSVVNASPSPLKVRLPTCVFDGRVRIGRWVLPLSFQLETVVLEPGELLITLAWRAAVACDKRPLQVEAVRLALQSLALDGRAA